MDTGLVILCVSITAVAIYLKSVAVMFASIMCWLGFAAYMFESWSAAYALDNTTPFWTSDRMFAWVGIALAFIGIFFILRFNNMIGRKEIAEVPPEQEFTDEYGKMVDQMNMYRTLRPRRRRN